jgi:HJR/Mrr/RecB family endonuclease
MFDISPRQFEEFISDLMAKRGYEVDLTKSTRDGGKDLIIASNKELGDLIFYVECKQ